MNAYKLLIPFEYLAGVLLLIVQIPLMLFALVISLFELPRYLRMKAK